MQNKIKKFIAYIIIISLLLGGIYLSPSGGGNGNPAILFIIPLLVLFVFFLRNMLITIKQWKNLSWFHLSIIIPICLYIIIVGWNYTAKNLEQTRIDLYHYYLKRNPDITYDHILEITYGINQFTSWVYFNFITLIMAISFFTIIFLFIQKIRK